MELGGLNVLRHFYKHVATMELVVLDVLRLFYKHAAPMELVGCRCIVFSINT
jgi:hypothetical protein